jgi:DNA polymerase-3 subunit delta'
LTTNEKLLPDTVISRCQRLELLPIVSNESEIILANKTKLERPKARFLIKISHGCLGWAILAASDETLVLQRNDRINELINVISGNYEERFTYVAKLADKFGQNREQIWHVLELWLDWWRDLLLVKLGCQDTITNVDFQEILVEIAEGYRLVQIRAYIDHIQRAARELSQYTNLRLVFEVLMLDMPKLSYNDR